MRIFAGAALLTPIALAFGADAHLPKFESPAALEAFFFPAAEEDIFNSMQAVFRLDNPGVLVTAAVNAGPEYALKVAATIDSPEFQRQYALLAKYLKVFQPCQKKQEAYCGEAAKLVFATTLWSQVHYCFQLATGEVKPKVGPAPSHGPPYRLDEPPVATQWVIADAVYAVTEAAISMRFQEVLRKRAAERANAEERAAILDAARELERKPIDRERAGLAILKMMLRNYEAVHLRHLERLL